MGIGGTSCFSVQIEYRSHVFPSRGIFVFWLGILFLFSFQELRVFFIVECDY